MTERIKTLRYKYREHFQKLHIVIRITLIGLFSILFVIGIITLLPLPELGIPLVLFSLSILSFQYKWAEQLLNRFEELFSNKVVKILLLVFGLIVVTAVVILWLK